jgi:predicted TIM-barrel fold metal-dependent hydrolase
MAHEFWDCHTHVFGPIERFPVAERRGYTPPVRTIEQLEENGRRAGIGHVVLVQPSIYGVDLTCMLEALSATDGRHRAVAVVDPGIGEERLAELDGLGVRGVRFNLVSPAGNRLDGFHAIARKIEPLGWHAQFFVGPEGLREVAELRSSTSIPFVLDHFGELPSSTQLDSPACRFLLDFLAHEDCWIKLSGFYRLSEAGAPYPDMDALVAALYGAAPERAVWGSDWPHTWFFDSHRGAPPAYEDTLAPIKRCLSAEQQQRVLRGNPARLYH